MRSLRLLKGLTVASLVTLSCGADVASHSGSASSAAIVPPQGRRDKLAASDLLNGNIPEIVHNDYFLPVGEVAAAGHPFSGVIQLAETPMVTLRPDSDWSGTGQRYFPALALSVIRSGDSLLPLQRGILYCGGRQRSFWNFIASPGRVWQEAGDNGWSRASFPFVLTDNSVGQALNGLATFLFTATAISPLAIQITQETSPRGDYTRADFRAVIPAQFVPRDFPEAAAVAGAYQAELAARPPVRSWSELPDAATMQTTFNGGLPPSSISMAALLVDGVLYLQPAETRSGPYPFPLDMRQGAYSVTKTLAMGLSMFYLAGRYGEDIFDARITDYVPALRSHSGWQDVTFANALDMATGTQGNDENLEFIRARSAADKLAEVARMPDASPAPGEVFSYASSNTFTLSSALTQYVWDREGAGIDYWLLVRQHVLEPLGIEHMPVVRTIESDGTPGTPVMGWGCYPTVIEVAQIGRLLSNQGWIEGRQLLNEARVREALEQTARRGLPAGSADSRYLHSFWFFDVPLPTGTVTAPYMSGRGGNLVVVLPGATVAIRFADENVYDIGPMVSVAEYYRRLHLRSERPEG